MCEKKKKFKKTFHRMKQCLNKRGGPTGRWKDRVEVYMCERNTSSGGGLEQAKREEMSGRGEVEALLPW